MRKREHRGGVGEGGEEGGEAAASVHVCVCVCVCVCIQVQTDMVECITCIQCMYI